MNRNTEPSEPKNHPQKKSVAPRPDLLQNFSDRLLMVSLPTAAVLLLLVFMEQLNPTVAIMSFAAVVSVTVVVILPFLYNLQMVAKYAREVTEKGEGELPPDVEKWQESGQIVHAINQMRTFWSERYNELKAQTLSDAAVLDSLPDPLVMIGHTRQVVGANLAARNLFSRPAKDRDLGILVSDPAILEATEKILAGNSRHELIQYTLSEDGREDRFFRVRIEPLPGHDEGSAVAVLAFYDVSSLVRLEQMQADFVANASHEMKTPLSILSGLIETLSGPARDDPEARDQFLAMMGVQTRRMNHLIQNLLSLSRLQMKEKKTPSGFVQVDSVLREVIKTLRPRAEETGTEILLNAPPDMPVIVGNEMEISQVFQNLIENALKYNTPGFPVTISLAPGGEDTGAEKERGPCLQVKVHNHGPVIPPHLIPRLTERFFRAEELSGEESGTGLGLAIVKHILTRHGGDLSITSREGEGTAFTVLLPIAPGALTDRRAEEWDETQDSGASSV